MGKRYATTRGEWCPSQSLPRVDRTKFFAFCARKVRAWNPVRSAHLSRQCSNSPYEGVVAGSSIRRWFLDMIDDEILHRSLFRLERQTKLFTQRVENRRAAA